MAQFLRPLHHVVTTWHERKDKDNPLHGQHIFFFNEYIYATNGFVLVKQHYTLHRIPRLVWEKMEGYILGNMWFEVIFRYGYTFDIQGNLFCFEGDEGMEHIPMKSITEIINPEILDEIITKSSKRRTGLNEVIISPQQMTILGDCTFGENKEITMKFARPKGLQVMVGCGKNIEQFRNESNAHVKELEVLVCAVKL